MPAKPFTAAKTWKRPPTRIYNDNYRFGNSLYSDAVADLDKRSVDRPMMSFRSYSPPPLSADAGVRRALLEAELGISKNENSELYRSLSATRLHQLSGSSNVQQSAASNYSSALAHDITTTTSVSRPITESFSAYASAKALADVEYGLEESRARRRRMRATVVRPESAYFYDELGVIPATTVATENTGPFWMERCREATSEVNNLNNELLDVESRIKSESSALKAKHNQDVTDLVLVLDEQDRVNQDMQKALKKQRQQIDELQVSAEMGQHKFNEALDTIKSIQRRAHQIAADIESYRSSSSSADKHLPYKATRHQIHWDEMNSSARLK